MKRKDFLYKSSILLGGSLLACKLPNNISERKQNNAVTFDLHTHPGVFYRRGTEAYAGDDAFIKRVEEMKTSGLNGAFFSLVADWPLLQRTATGILPNGSFKGDEGWKVLKDQLSALKALLEKSATQIALTGKELKHANHFKAYIACEGGDFMGSNIGRVEDAYKEGIRSIQLVHYAPNELGDLQTWKAAHDGLSNFGKTVVKKMNALGMLIDVAHASAKTVKDVTSISSAPVILSHSILKEGVDRPIAARAISEDHAKMVSEGGGVIGMWPSGFSASFDEFVQHTLRMVDVVGINHVGIGTDMDSNFKPVISNYEGFFNWKTALLKKGLSKQEVAKLAGGNAQRVLEEVLGSG